MPMLDPRRVRWVSEEVGYLNKPLPLAGRVVYLLLVVFLLQFGVRHLLARELILPPLAKHPAPIRVDGWPLFLVCSAALCGAASLLTVVVYQYSSKAAERPYTFIARGCGIVGWALFASSPFVYLLQLFTR
jgi:hypothetical protein